MTLEPFLSPPARLSLRAHRRKQQAATQIERPPLREFLRAAWPVLEPATAFVPGWHIDALAEHLEALSAGQLQKLIVNIPPGSMKSLTVSVLWPVWDWIKHPARRFLTASYAQTLATRDSLKSRRLIQSAWFQSRWGEAFHLTGDQNQKMRYENDRTGFRLSTSVGGATGERADVRILDDPHNIDEIHSDTMRESVIDWVRYVWSERVADSQTSLDVVIMQRLHQRDVSGYLLDEVGGYEHLMLPMRFEPERRCVTVLGFSDPRTQAGDLLCPARQDETAVQAREKQLGSYGTAGQFQQRPVPRSGGMFKRAWFPIVAEAPRAAVRVRYWDKAGTEAGHGTTAHTCGVLIARDAQGLIYIEDVVRGQWSAGQRETIVKQTAETDALKYGQVGVRIWHEQEPGSGGKESAEATTRNLAGFVVQADRVTGSKEARAEPLANQAEAGNVRLVLDEWNKEYLDHVCLFPLGTYKDEVDASSGAFNKLPRTPLNAGEILEKVTKPEPSKFNRSGTGNRWGRH